jgi:histidinol-phosphatase (PHP family)
VPWFSYHGGHSGEFCRHATGTLQDVVRSAIDAGFTTYGLSEHAPRYRAEDLFPDESGLSVADLGRLFDSYVGTAVELRDRYADRIELLVGFESEVVPPQGWAEHMREIRKRYPQLEYVVGSVHHVGGTCIDMSPDLTARAAEAAGGKEALQRRYFDLVAEMVACLRPQVVGHFDLIRKFEGSEPRFSAGTWAHIESALEAVRDVGAALDVNAAPARRGTGPVYPLPRLLERARQMEIPVTLGDDSHGPADVGLGLEACMRAIARAGYERVHYLTRERGSLHLASAPIGEVGSRAQG